MNYTVKSGDTLSIIARDVLKDISRWKEIQTLNNISNENLIYPGQVLVLPDPAGTIVPGKPAGQGSTGTATPATSSIDPWGVGALVLLAIAAGIGVHRHKMKKKAKATTKPKAK